MDVVIDSPETGNSLECPINIDAVKPAFLIDPANNKRDILVNLLSTFLESLKL